jgi:predicted RNase H-like HicB family nuclease
VPSSAGSAAVCWREDGAWLGFWSAYPEFWTQGENLSDLRAHLVDLLADLRSGEIPGLS